MTPALASVVCLFTALGASGLTGWVVRRAFPSKRAGAGAPGLRGNRAGQFEEGRS